jgi:hypothetical protein
MIILTKEEARRFWLNVDIKKPDDCWDWKLSKHKQGYGKVQTSGVNGRRKVLAHKVAYELTYGPMADGNFCLHTCDNPSCCNPNHLYEGTQKDNVRDRNERNPVSASIFGSGKSKLYAGEIWLIRKLKMKDEYGNYKFSLGLVAKMFNVSKTTIHKIWKAESWLCREGYYA